MQTENDIPLSVEEERGGRSTRLKFRIRIWCK
jgi:hypothetical protein